jgi:hypothetical protein
MAIVSINEIHDGGEGSCELQGSKSVRSYTHPVRIITDDPHDGAWEIMLALPALGTSMADVLSTLRPVALGDPPAVVAADPYAFLISKLPKRDAKSKIIWTAPLRFSTDRPLKPNPLDDPPVIEWDTEEVTISRHFDIDGKAILNAAGDFFADGVRAEVQYWTASIKINMAEVPTWLPNYRNAINAAAFTIDGYTVPAYCAKIKRIHISRWQFRNDVAYKEIQIVLKIVDGTIVDKDGNPLDTWRKAILNQGVYCFVDFDDETFPTLHTRCSDDSGVLCNRPQLLDADGYQLRAEDVQTDPTLANFIFARVFPECDFSVFALSYTPSSGS